MHSWREAMTRALYGAEGFFARAPAGGAAHFATAARSSPQFAEAVARLVSRVDDALDRPDPFEVVDVGAGGGELLAGVLAAAPEPLAARLRPTAVEPHPPAQSPDDRIGWRSTAPEQVAGLLVATEWLDNVPLDVAEVDDDGTVRYVLVDQDGRETLSQPVTGDDAAWLARWWPLPATPGLRAEIGASRDHAWADAVATVTTGLALAVDYGHTAGQRPALGTLAGYRGGREVPPVPDGSCDLTAHVALDAVAAAGRQAAGQPGDAAAPVLVPQSEALRALGVHGARPPRALAELDPAAYLRRLSAASAAAALTDPAGLGGHRWLLQPVGQPAGPAADRVAAAVAGLRT